jgi:hypothetical protein
MMARVVPALCRAVPNDPTRLYSVHHTAGILPDRHGRAYAYRPNDNLLLRVMVGVVSTTSATCQRVVGLLEYN